MSNREILPGIEVKQGFSTFCKNYIDYRKTVEKNLQKYNDEISAAENDLRNAQDGLANYSNAIKRTTDACKEHETKIKDLLSQIGQTCGDKEGLEELDAAMQAELDGVHLKYADQKKSVEHDYKLQGLARAQNKSYFDLLEKNRNLYYRMMAYKKPTEQRVEALKNAFPTQVEKIQSAMEGQLFELVGSDYEFEERFNSYHEASGVFQPLKLMETINYVIKPNLYPYDFLQKKEFLLTKILVAALLIVGIVLAFIKHSVFIPVAVVLSLLPVSRLRKKHDAQLTDSLDLKELKLYHTILAYTEKDAERLARKSVNLPECSAKEYRAQSEHKEKQMQQEKKTEEGRAASCTSQLLTARLKQKQLQEEYGEITKDVHRDNSRLHEALRRKQNGIELTEHQARLIQEYDAKIADWTNRNEKNEHNVNHLENQIKKSQGKAKKLEREIPEFRESYARIAARLEAIEQIAAGGCGLSLEEQLGQLNQKEQVEQDHIRSRYAQEKEKLSKALDAEVQRKVHELQTQLAKEKKQLERAEAEQQQIEEENRDNEDRLKQINEKVDEAQRLYNEENRLLGRLKSSQVWMNNLTEWRKKHGPNSRMDVSNFTVADTNYVVGPEGPYELPHNCRPCVLLYDDKENDANALELLKTTIQYIQASIAYSNLSGMVEFALLNEYSLDDSMAEKMICYTKNQMGQLYDSLCEKRQKLLKEKAYGTSVKAFNEAFSQARLREDYNLSKEDFFRQRKECELAGDEDKKNKLKEMEDSVVQHLSPTLFLFVLPTPNEENRPMNHEGLWGIVRGNCQDYGFVPLFLVPKDRWENAKKREGYQTEFSKAVQDLEQYTKASKTNISIHK